MMETYIAGFLIGTFVTSVIVKMALRICVREGKGRTVGEQKGWENTFVYAFNDFTKVAEILLTYSSLGMIGVILWSLTTG